MIYSSFNLNIFLRLVFSNSENSIVVLLKPFLLLLIKILRTLSVLSKAKLETLEAVDANASGQVVCSRICLANEFRQYLIEGLHLPSKGILWFC
jgi:hypothetical protein